jgi:hydrogenase maturation protease
VTVRVVGVGNRQRGDDAVGPLVADRVGALGLPGIEVVADCEPLDLVELLDRDGLLVVVDAMTAGDSPGRVRVWHADRLPRALPGGRASGSHGWGVLDAVDLARTLGRLRARFVVVGVEAESVAPGAPLSRAVCDSLGAATAAVVRAVSAAHEAPR